MHQRLTNKGGDHRNKIPNLEYTQSSNKVRFLRCRINASKENEYAAAAAAAAAKFILPRKKIWKSVEIHGGVNIHRRGKTERCFQRQ